MALRVRPAASAISLRLARSKPLLEKTIRALCRMRRRVSAPSTPGGRPGPRVRVIGAADGGRGHMAWWPIMRDDGHRREGARMKTLVIGGSGSSGVPVVHGLLERGHDVTMLHRGVHEPPELPPVSQVPHIHADPHFAETLTEAVGDTEYDLVLAMYGRVAVIADVFAKRCGQLVSIGGVPAYRGCLQPDTVKPYGMAVNAREDGPLADSAEPVPKFAKPIRAAERAVFEHAANGDFQGSVVRYCQIYGPRNLVPWEWSVVKRVLDGRQQMILPDAGLGIISRCAARNAAEVVLKVVDNPGIADGQAYNVGDDDQFSIRQWAEAVATVMGAELEFVPIPSEV